MLKRWINPGTGARHLPRNCTELLYGDDRLKLAGAEHVKPMPTRDAANFNVNKSPKMSDADDLTREVYGISGIPVDAVDMATVLHRIYAAAGGSAALLISTANLNYLVASRTDEEFRETLLRSDLCTADGTPIVWIARLLGLPIHQRIAGSDIFDALKTAQNPVHHLKVFLFGGADGAAAAASERINSESSGLTCIGWYEPGFDSVEEMSTNAILDTINSSNADFLAVALGAKKGQAWLLKNHDRLRIPVRVHLGATINFQAGSVKRAPKGLQKLGLEWLWRIKEEPKLLRNRYLGDGTTLLRLLLTKIIPLALLERWYRLRLMQKGLHIDVTSDEDNKAVILTLNGAATRENVNIALPPIQAAASAKKTVVVNFANTRLIDARFIGLLLMLHKQLKQQGHQLRFTGVNSRVDKNIQTQRI